jgi:hypothetical protein
MHENDTFLVSEEDFNNIIKDMNTGSVLRRDVLSIDPFIMLFESRTMFDGEPVMEYQLHIDGTILELNAAAAHAMQTLDTMHPVISNEYFYIFDDGTDVAIEEFVGLNKGLILARVLMDTEMVVDDDLNVTGLEPYTIAGLAQEHYTQWRDDEEDCSPTVEIPIQDVTAPAPIITESHHERSNNEIASSGGVFGTLAKQFHESKK